MKVGGLLDSESGKLKPFFGRKINLELCFLKLMVVGFHFFMGSVNYSNLSLKSFSSERFNNFCSSNLIWIVEKFVEN